MGSNLERIGSGSDTRMETGTTMCTGRVRVELWKKKKKTEKKKEEGKKGKVISRCRIVRQI